MPTYTFLCDPEKNGCGHTFELCMLMCDYSPTQQCPDCKSLQPVHRYYEVDMPQTSVKLSDDEITVGHLAQRNTEKFSNDKKEALKKKHNEYKTNKPKTPLPDGMSYVRK